MRPLRTQATVLLIVARRCADTARITHPLRSCWCVHFMNQVLPQLDLLKYRKENHGLQERGPDLKRTAYQKLSSGLMSCQLSLAITGLMLITFHYHSAHSYSFADQVLAQLDLLRNWLIHLMARSSRARYGDDFFAGRTVRELIKCHLAGYLRTSGVVPHSSSWTASAYEPQNRQLHPRCRRVTSMTAGYDCVTDHTKRGRLGTRAGIPKRLRPNCHCKSPRSRGLGTPSGQAR